MNKTKLCISAMMLGLMLLAAAPVSAQNGPPPRVCALLAMLGVPLPPGCTDVVDEEEKPVWFPEEPAADTCANHPGVMPRPGFSVQNPPNADGIVVIDTPPTVFAPSSSQDNLPLNLCANVYENARDADGKEIPNTLPSTPDNPYNLHPQPVLTPLDNPTNPREDLQAVIAALSAAVDAGQVPDAGDIQFGLDILEGNPIADRAYSGMPLLHYNGPNKVKQVQPVLDDQGNTIGGTVELHQVWWDGRIMGDTALLDPSLVQNVPWTMIVHADVLNNGHEDMAPYQMYFDDPASDLTPPTPIPHIAMDITFFPMPEDYRTTFEFKMAPGRYFNLTYFWGWRVHPPRVQVTENALKRAGMGENNRTLVEWEEVVFGTDPQGSEANKLAAIGMIGDLAPAKRMWNLLRDFQANPNLVDEAAVAAFDDAFQDWRNRLALPSGIEPDPDFDVNLIYLNNTIYGNTTPGVFEQTVDFNQPGDQVKVKMMNGDYFPHAWMFVDFGGNRGWENTYQSTVEIDGAGPWFTFGRNHWWPMLAPAPPLIPPATPASGTAMSIQDTVDWLSAGPQAVTSTTGAAKSKSNPVQFEYSMMPEWLDLSKSVTFEHNYQLTETVGDTEIGVGKFYLNMNHTPSSRLKMYNFDPLHHDIAVWSIH
ncbi:MAG: hypothetical protein LC637_09570 [Xanthomonadaceae bacterium]|nr:hypothetical protein [Xanthomonadaceae bacterium]